LENTWLLFHEWCGWQRSTRRPCAAQQAVVLDVIGRGELKVGPEGDQHAEHQRLGSERQNQRRPEQQRHRGRLKDFVVQGPERLSGALQAVALQAPGALERARHLAPDKGVDALAHARRSRIRRRGHIPVVTAVVFDEEMPVTGWR